MPMEILSMWQGALVSSWSFVLTAFLGVVPKIFGAIVVFSIGLVLAYWAKKAVLELLRISRVSQLTKSAGIDQYLTKADIKHDFAGLVGEIVQWLIILVFFLSVVDILGLNVVSQVLTSVLSYIPNVIAAALIFAAGYIVAGVAGGLVRGALTSIDHDVAKPIGKLARYTILLVAFFAALDQLQIAKGLIVTFFQGLTYTVVLVVGLSFGLGAKDLVAKILTDWYEKIRK